MKRQFAAVLAAGTMLSGALAAPVEAQELPVPPELENLRSQLPQFPDFPSPDEAFEIGKLPGTVPVQIPEPRVGKAELPNQEVAESYVSFGDSVAANPSQLDIAATRLKGRVPGYSWPTIRDGKCAQGVGNFPSKTAVKTGLRLADYSCGGATAYSPSDPANPIPHNTLNAQVDSAIANGDLDGRTRLVSISIGVNDFYQPGNGPEMGQEGRNARYDSAVGRAIDRIHAAAPNARVVMVGLPDQTDGANHTCPTNLYGVVSKWYFPFVSYYQDELRESQRRVSENHGADFLDMVAEINLANNNNGCSTNPNRLSASIFDDAPHNFTFHLTDKGNDYYAQRLADTYRS